MEKQIEEIRCENCIHHFACRLNGEYDPSPCRAYEDKAGYRKQSEGEWVAKETMIRSPYARNCYCSECKYEPIEVKSYCPNCGARMKDGEG